MQHIAVIGGTGMTGQHVIDYALEKGLKVNLLYRNEKTLPERFKGRLTLVQGDVTDLDACKRVLEGVEGVCIVLGTRNNLDATTELSTGTKNLIAAMKKKNIDRFSIVMSAFLFRKPEDVPNIFTKLNDEHKRMHDLTVDSGLNYIAIWPPHIADEPSSEYTITHDGIQGRTISKYDLAKFIVDCLNQPEHFQKVCGISTKSASN